MLIHLRPNDNWEQINTAIKKELGITDPKIAVHTFKNIGQGLFDFLLGLRQFLPHKKTVIYIEGGDPYIHSLTVPLYREAYQVITLKPDFLSRNPNSFDELPKDILCVLTSRDHAFTAEHWVDSSLMKILIEKKVPVLEISHNIHFSRHFQDEIANRPFLLQVQDYDGIAVGIVGSRTKIYTQSSPLNYWNFDDTMSCFSQAKVKNRKYPENEKTILEFEAGVLAPATPYFDSHFKKRTFDRAVISLNKVTGDHFLNKLKTELNQLENNDDFATPHLCQWGGFGHFTWWGHDGISPEKQMTLVALSLNFVSQKNSLKIFNETLSACLKENKLV